MTKIDHYLRSPECVAKLLARQSDCWRVHDWHQLLDIFAEQLVEEALVAVQKVDHVEVLVQGLRVAADCEKTAK